MLGFGLLQSGREQLRELRLDDGVFRLVSRVFAPLEVRVLAELDLAERTLYRDPLAAREVLAVHGKGVVALARHACEFGFHLKDGRGFPRPFL